MLPGRDLQRIHPDVNLSDFLPAGLDPLMALALIALSFVSSLITATFSLGGGILMLALLASIFPPAIVVPVHGAIQLGSNAGRTLLQRAHIQWSFVLWMTLGAAIGTVVGGQFAHLLPEQVFTALIGAFILVSVWLPQPRIVGTSRIAQVVGGGVIGMLSMLVGATGPLVAVFLRGLPVRQHLVATHAMLMTFQNGFKVIVFMALGFAFASYLPLILVMIVAGFGGTAMGGRFLLSVPELAFRWGFKIVLSLVALNLVRAAVFG